MQKNLCKLNALNIFKDTAWFRPTEKLQLGPDPISGVKDKDKRKPSRILKNITGIYFTKKEKKKKLKDKFWVEGN